MQGSESHISGLFKFRLDSASFSFFLFPTSFHLYPQVFIKPIFQGQSPLASFVKLQQFRTLFIDDKAS